ncbi:MAG: extracellular solute-binding protein, partial [Betaproteobacteria bacterium]|nr:extracellular solute-binding protein [Betaproteobacteria bacterium]
MQSNVVDGKVAAMPGFADAMFMYYRKDLFRWHGIAEPKIWDELPAASKKIQAGEGNPNSCSCQPDAGIRTAFTFGVRLDPDRQGAQRRVWQAGRWTSGRRSRPEPVAVDGRRRRDQEERRRGQDVRIRST